MRFLVAPEFSAKLSQVSDEGRVAIANIVRFVESAGKDSLSAGGPGIDVRSLSEGIVSIRAGSYRIYASFNQDDGGEYLLLLDLTAEQDTVQPSAFVATKDPTRNPMLDPNRNAMIDPRRNMMIDPNRNMMIDPRRNMMIDPRRNMMIDPNRNMMIDPRRNMMIDPNRNMMIDPNRNMMIDPRRNRFYGGPYLYSTNLQKQGFVVRANDEVSLIFDLSGRFVSFIARNGSEGSNVFDTHGRWVEFLVRPQEDVWLRFDVNGRWLGLIV